MRAVVVGCGAVGVRAARQLASSVEITKLVIVSADATRAGAVADSLGPTARAHDWSPAVLDGADVVVIARPAPLLAAEAAVDAGVSVVACADDPESCAALLRLDARARAHGVSVAVGAGLAPGLSCVLARFAAIGLDHVDEVHVAKAGTGGPACARQHHRALAAECVDWRDRVWTRHRGGSGRELYWFPDPVGALDCYRAGLADAQLLTPAFPGVQRVTSRVAASRRDRWTGRFPMLRPPHPEGEVGAVRVEVRGNRGEQREAVVVGAIDRPAVAAGAVAAVAAVWSGTGRMARPGAAGLAELVTDAAAFLGELSRRGVKAAAFEGASG